MKRQDANTVIKPKLDPYIGFYQVVCYRTLCYFKPERYNENFYGRLGLYAPEITEEIVEFLDGAWGGYFFPLNDDFTALINYDSCDRQVKFTAWVICPVEWHGVNEIHPDQQHQLQDGLTWIQELPDGYSGRVVQFPAELWPSICDAVKELKSTLVKNH